MKAKYRVMANDENGENIVNELFNSFRVAEVFYDKHVQDNTSKEVILDKVHFDKNGEWLENEDEVNLAWREEGY